MKTTPHWTERSTEDFAYKIAADFAQQIENHLSSTGGNQTAFAQSLGVTPARISQVLNKPGNMTLTRIVKYARATGKKVAIVLYDDNDPTNASGPVNSQVFEQCWIRNGKPSDMFELDEPKEQALTFVMLVPGNQSVSVPIAPVQTDVNSIATSFGTFQSVSTGDRPRIIRDQIGAGNNG